MTDLQSSSTLQLLHELKRRYVELDTPPGRYVFVGAPGSGKGTQSCLFSKSHSLCHLSTGDILRQTAMQSDDIGLKVKKQMQEGKLVDDDIVLKLLNEKMNEPSCMRGFILDGFPRNAHQAEKLHNYLEKSGKKLDGVMYFGAPDELLVKRIEGRRVHPTSGRVYHTEFNPPKVEGKDDVTGEPLIQRSDDNAVTLFERLKCYHKETTPLIDYYSNLGLLSHIDASKSVDKVQKEINTVIAKKEQNGHPEPLVNGNSG